jgi:hypothetical protein
MALYYYSLGPNYGLPTYMYSTSILKIPLEKLSTNPRIIL